MPIRHDRESAKIFLVDHKVDTVVRIHSRAVDRGTLHNQTQKTMNKITVIQTTLLSALALGLALSASAQPMQNSTATPADSTGAYTGPGLVGTRYAEVSFGYLKQEGTPSDLRDYEYILNANIIKMGALGLDANLRYDYVDSHANGFNDYRHEALAGLTGFLVQSWGTPFVTGDAGMAWQNAGGVSRRSFAYTFTAGVEFPVLKDLVLTPFAEYQAEPQLYNRQLPGANFPNHILYYGVKATYSITREWSVSLSPDLDQHSVKDWGLRGGVSYRF